MEPLLHTTRRHFFSRCSLGLGSMALAALMNRGSAWAGTAPTHPMAAKPPQFPAKAKNIIYLFMAGGPSQLDLFDYKPKLAALNGKPIPDSYLEGKRFAFMDSSFKNRSTLLGSRRSFRQHGQSGMWVSELFPHTAGMVDDLTFIRSCATNVFNHAPAKLFMNTGSSQFGRPSMGSWVTYGLGSTADNLPGFVVLQSGPRGPRGGSVNWGSGFLPTAYQGVPLRSQGEPILNLSTPSTIAQEQQERTVNAVKAMNLQHLVETGDAEIATRIAAYEMAYRMQTSVPDVMDITREPARFHEMYGTTPGRASFANNCLLARRLVERGVRFVQLYHRGWDHHGGPDGNLVFDLKKRCQETDQPAVALIRDLKERGLLDTTLVVWGGEFGRTPMMQGALKPDQIGRDHHPHGYTIWMAGGGIKPGTVYGKTDDFGFYATENKVHVHDLHATILHLFGFDHTRLTYRFQGRDFRLTDVHGEVVKPLLA